MKAMILAAGRGERMEHLTRDNPKPLISVKGKPLIEWHLEKLSATGFKDVVINVCYLPQIIKNFVGDGSTWQLNVTYSEENPILETAGGIKNALPIIGKEPFAVINADIFSDFDYSKLRLINLNNSSDGYLVLVSNPEHNLAGDFGLLENNYLVKNSKTLYTFSGIAVYHPRFFNGIEAGVKMQLLPLLNSSISKSLIKGELFKGVWSDIGTPERLEIVNNRD
jgi:N-acetyl-alpha-D-muramate 1-phosphate uridylyltransferase